MIISRRQFFAGLLACPICAVEAEAPQWNYDNASPQKWADLDPAFKICGLGDQQSPVNLHDGIKAKLPPLHVNWKAEAFKAWNNQHTIQLNAHSDSCAVIGTTTFNLVQFHFHTPSEHAIQGQRAAMEVHFVHKHEDGRLLVLGALITPGEANDAFSAIMQVAPVLPGEQMLGCAINPHRLLPKSLDSAWRYEGSLTTPPCSQIVDWIVFQDTVSVAQADIDKFKQLFPMNARPLQPLDRRYLLFS